MPQFPQLAALGITPQETDDGPRVPLGDFWNALDRELMRAWQRCTTRLRDITAAGLHAQDLEDFLDVQHAAQRQRVTRRATA